MALVAGAGRRCTYTVCTSPDQGKSLPEVILPPIRGSLPEVIRSWCAHHHHHHKVFAGRLNARGTRTRLPRRPGGAWPARRRRDRDLGAAATPLARRPLAMSHRTGAPLERGGGGGSKVLHRGVPPHPRPRQELEARLAPSLSSSAQHMTFSTSPLPPGDNVRSYAGSTQVGRARARSAPAFGAERVARGSDPAATGARGRGSPPGTS